MRFIESGDIGELLIRHMHACGDSSGAKTHRHSATSQRCLPPRQEYRQHPPATQFPQLATANVVAEFCRQFIAIAAAFFLRYGESAGRCSTRSSGRYNM